MKNPQNWGGTAAYSGLSIKYYGNRRPKFHREQRKIDKLHNRKQKVGAF